MYCRLECLLDSFKEPVQGAVSNHPAQASSSASNALACHTFEENASEVDNYELPSKKFSKRVGMPNSFDKSDPDLALLGDTFKCLLNSGYGSTSLNKENFSNTKYMNGHSSVKLEVNKPEFKKATLLSDEMYEVEKRKTMIALDVPIQIEFTILNYAKLRMLEFYYDCLQIYPQKQI